MDDDEDMRSVRSPEATAGEYVAVAIVCEGKRGKGAASTWWTVRKMGVRCKAKNGHFPADNPRWRQQIDCRSKFHITNPRFDSKYRCAQLRITYCKVIFEMVGSRRCGGECSAAIYVFRHVAARRARGRAEFCLFCFDHQPPQAPSND